MEREKIPLLVAGVSSISTKFAKYLRPFCDITLRSHDIFLFNWLSRAERGHMAHIASACGETVHHTQINNKAKKLVKVSLNGVPEIKPE